jgi:hypothetical protein
MLPLVLLGVNGTVPANTLCPDDGAAMFSVQGSGLCKGTGVEVEAKRAVISKNVASLVQRLNGVASVRANLLNTNFTPSACAATCSISTV